jgi:hypothetical protein
MRKKNEIFKIFNFFRLTLQNLKLKIKKEANLEEIEEEEKEGNLKKYLKMMMLVNVLYFKV